MLFFMKTIIYENYRATKFFNKNKKQVFVNLSIVNKKYFKKINTNKKKKLIDKYNLF